MKNMNGISVALEEQDLFSYPNRAGFKRSGTSEIGAKSVDSKSLQARVLSVLRNTDATSDECASRLGESILSIRPRLSELLSLGKIVETDMRRPNKSGKLASVWRAI